MFVRRSGVSLPVVTAVTDAEGWSCDLCAMCLSVLYVVGIEIHVIPPRTASVASPPVAAHPTRPGA